MDRHIDWMPPEDILNQCDRVQVVKHITGTFNLTFHLFWYKEQSDIRVHKAVTYDGYGNANEAVKEVCDYFVRGSTWKLIDDTHKNAHLYARITS